MKILFDNNYLEDRNDVKKCLFNLSEENEKLQWLTKIIDVIGVINFIFSLICMFIFIVASSLSEMFSIWVIILISFIFVIGGLFVWFIFALLAEVLRILCNIEHYQRIKTLDTIDELYKKEIKDNIDKAKDIKLAPLSKE